MRTFESVACTNSTSGFARTSPSRARWRSSRTACGNSKCAIRTVTCWCSASTAMTSTRNWKPRLKRPLNPDDLQGYCAEIPAANIQRDCGAAARYADAGECDQFESRGACVHFFGRARRGENHQRTGSGEGAELREGADG